MNVLGNLFPDDLCPSGISRYIPFRLQLADFNKHILFVNASCPSLFTVPDCTSNERVNKGGNSYRMGNFPLLHWKINETIQIRISSSKLYFVPIKGSMFLQNKLL